MRVITKFISEVFIKVTVYKIGKSRWLLLTLLKQRTTTSLFVTL